MPDDRHCRCCRWRYEYLVESNMDGQDRAAIDGVFQRLSKIEQSGQPRDPEAEQFIQSKLNDQPGAGFYLAQTVLVQEQALLAAQQKIESLEKSGAATAGAASGLGYGFGRSASTAAGQEAGAAREGAAGLGGAALGAANNTGVGALGSGGTGRVGALGTGGAGTNAFAGANATPAGSNPSAGGFGRQANQGRAGGFLAGAAQTAMGVAGGLMLGSFLGGLLGGNDAEAAPADAAGADGTDAGAADTAGADQGADPGYDAGMDDGGGFDDMGGFDDF